MNLFDVVWRKATRSANNGSCVEVGVWRKPDRDTRHDHGFAAAPGEFAVLARDSKNPDGHTLAFGREAWHAFVSSTKAGRFDFG